MALPTPSYICLQCLRASKRLPTPSTLIFSTSRSRQYSITSYATSRISSRRFQTPSYSPRRYERISFSTLQPCRAPETVSTSAATTPLPPPSSQSTTTTAILNPRVDEDGAPMTVEITPRATRRLNEIMKKEQNTKLHLRITVESGGCHGFQYLMSLTSDVDIEEDTVFVAGENTAENGGEGKAKVVMDEPSLELLKGSKIDYTMELIGSQFKIVDNPRASSSCGCGTSFDVKI
ncbi:hypothetical protein EJ08DRAFT_652129 [Tothia fuscella]|uniref:Core domain-containing protein n=1 Tax=Tothia fuscella TaxID=1048955 RepID=A0A9P4TVX9_9PEZI|nr:hypothetical protein EJ08DRAFT_652129 [Tothia fuscella]